MFKGRYFTFVLVFVLVLATLVSVTGAGAAPKSALSVSLSADKSSFSASDAVLVNVTISNNGKNSVKVLKWFTPVEDVEEALFTVSRDSAKVDYVGAYYKRTAPTGNDYVTLKAGESFTRTVDLGLYYDLSASGVYELEYDANVTGLASNKLQLAVDGRAGGAPLVIVPDAVSGSTSFISCTAARQADLITARNNASTYAAGALSYLNAHTSSTSRYATWFGIFSTANYNTVKSHYTAIGSAMDTQPITFDCTCKKKTTYAFVYPNQPYTITLCGAFWTAPATGTDSKAGTLIHEMSHFNVVAGTDDWAYGQTNAKALAISDPAKAIDNADSHEYFAENTPALP